MSTRKKYREKKDPDIIGNLLLLLVLFLVIKYGSNEQLSSWIDALSNPNSLDGNQIVSKIRELENPNNFSVALTVATVAPIPTATPQPTSTPIPLLPGPTIQGDAQFVANWNAAFQILQNKAPHHWNFVSGRVLLIKQDLTHQHSWIDGQGIFSVGWATLVANGNSQQQLDYMACALPHEACHAERRRDAGSKAIPYTPGAAEELACFPIQVQCLTVLGDNGLAESVRQQDGNHIYQYWKDDFGPK